ncbi:hypothetical protein NDU88_001445 [Pleurodeles waltl]|uniref:Uncharacterized protein n=1 Tax=Pleurodeles waltl TaxID=8319 RepID=A0AAV7KRH8_PLEWA|nr:hypothetical protein NDU88_001445 [Pleurodeles waltl]
METHGVRSGQEGGEKAKGDKESGWPAFRLYRMNNIDPDILLGDKHKSYTDTRCNIHRAPFCPMQITSLDIHLTSGSNSHIPGGVYVMSRVSETPHCWGTIGSAQLDPEVVDTVVSNQEMANTEAGRVFKPQKTSPEGGRCFPGGDIDGRLTQQSGAETAPGQLRSLERQTNPRCRDVQEAKQRNTDTGRFRIVFLPIFKL